jgi:gliding motility-associated-like protein
MLLCFFLLQINSSDGQTISFAHSIYHGFIENKGQWDKEVLFQSKFAGGNLWIQQKKFVFHLQDLREIRESHGATSAEGLNPLVSQALLEMNFSGANEVTLVENSYPTKHYYNYFIGEDKNKWVGGVYAYQESILRDFYKGIDLKLVEQEQELKYEFHVKPFTDPNVIQFNYNGADEVIINDKGTLIIKTKLGSIQEEKPYAYQIVNGKILEIPCVFKLNNGTVSFELGAYNPKVTLVIDPILVFATYSGSITDNFGMTATYGYDGTAYSAGIIYGNQYPTPDPLAWDVNSNITVSSTNVATTDAFISKYSSDGTTMLWTTFIGGGDNFQGTETAHSLICDPNNNVYLYGVTSSTDFPVQGGFQSSHAGGQALSVNFNGTNFGTTGTDIFVAKFSSNGQNLLGSTYIGGSSNDGVNYKLTSGNYNSVAAYDSLTTNYGDQFRGEIMLDQDGNCLIASCTRSNDFPTLNAFQANNAGMQDGVVFKMSTNLNSLIWSSYYGGTNNDACYSIKVDSSYAVVFSGGTSSLDIPFTTGGFQSSYGGGKADGFVVKLASNGLNVQQATYLGMNEMDQAFFVEIDRNDNVFVLGQSVGGNFPVTNSNYSNPGSSQFIIKLNPELSVNQRSTVFGNGMPNINISPAAFLIDICGNAYISGWGANILQAAPLNGMPVTSNAFQAVPPDGFDFYLLVIKRDFEDILYGTYLGGAFADEHVDGGTSRFDKNGVVYQSVCGGCGGQSDFPVSAGAWSAQNLSSNCNNLIFKFDFQLIPNAEFTADQTIGCQDFEVTLDNFSTTSDSYIWDFGNGDTSSVIFNPTILYSQPGVYDIYLYVTDSVCLLTDTAQITITVLDSISLEVNDVQPLCSPVPMTFTANSFGTANNFIWSSSLNFSDTLNVNPQDSTLNITPPGSTTYYVQAGNDYCSQVDSVTIIFTSSSLVLFANDSICADEIVFASATDTNPIISFTYEWGPSNILTSPSTGTSATFVPDSSQYVYILASASNGCIIEDSLFIAVSEIADGTVQATASEYLVPEGASVTLFGNPDSLIYSWTPTDVLSNPNSQNTQAIVNQSTIFTLTATDGICVKSDTVLVNTYGFICEDSYIYIPNAFTPNNDSENDVLYVRGQLIESMIFRVFDRWGEMVFESTDRNYGWDGTFRGKLMDPDVYDYYLQAVCIDGGEAIIKGNITLIR